MIDIFFKYHDAFVKGLKGTLSLTFITWSVGLSFGLTLGILSFKNSIIKRITKTVGFILSGIPVLVLLLWLHYPAQKILHIVVDPFYTAALTFSVVNIFAVETIVYSAFAQLPKEYRQAGRICGLSDQEILKKIELPLLIRKIVSPLLVSQVSALHLTLFASLISVEELLRISQQINSLDYKIVEVYSILGIFFLMVSLPVNAMAICLNKKFGRDLSER